MASWYKLFRRRTCAASGVQQYMHESIEKTKKKTIDTNEIVYFTTTLVLIYLVCSRVLFSITDVVVVIRTDNRTADV